MEVMQRIRRRFHQACADYRLLEDGDRVLVALSGGKDSRMLVRLLGEQARLFVPRIDVAAAHVVMDNIAYHSPTQSLEAYCADYGVPFHLLHASFDATTDHRHTPCFLCAWNRRKALFQFAQQNGFNKLALGHHQDDFLVTYLMNITFEGRAETMQPLMQMEHYPLQVIRPLCLVEEEWIRAEDKPLQIVTGDEPTLCPHETTTQRAALTKVFHHLEALNPEARYSLWRAATQVHKN